MRVHSSRLALALVFGVVFLGRDPASAGETPPPSSSTAHHFLLPIGNGRKLFSRAEIAPTPVLGFWAAQGRDWSLYWDSVLGTPRFVVPSTNVVISVPTPMAHQPVPALTKSIEDFVDLNQSFLGVSSETLGEPYIYTLVGDWVYVFPQTTLSGIPIRGACLRVVVNESGRLRWIKAFVARNVPEIGGELLDEAAARARVDSQAAEVLSANLEIGFGTDRIDSARAVWSLWIRGADEDETELILDAKAGAPLAHRRIVKYLDGQGGGEEGAGAGAAFRHTGLVVGTYPPRTDFFASVWITPSKEQGVPNVSIRNGNDELKPIAMTDLTGNFETVTPYLPAILDADMETTWFTGGEPEQILSLFPKRGRGYIVIPRMDDDQNYIPDLRGLHNQDLVTYRLFESRVFNPPKEGDTAVTPEEIAWWLQSFDFAADQLQRASRLLSRMLGAKGMDLATLLPLSNLRLQAANSPDSQATYHLRPRGHGFINAGIGRLVVDDKGVTSYENVSVPTFIQHEVGHHLFHSITNTSLPSVDPKDYPLEAKVLAVLEESVGNALAAMHNDDQHIGFVKLPDGKLVPTSEDRATDLSVPPPRTGDVVKRIQGEYQTAFWTLHSLMKGDKDNPFSPNAESTEALLLLWLGYNRVGEGSMRNFDNTHNLAEELALAIDTGPFGGNDDISDGVPFGHHIQAAFQDVIHFDTHFQRGNANGDERVDLSDAVFVLAFLFQGDGKFRDCLNAMDADNNGSIELTDAVRILQHLFLGGAPLDSPFRECGLDPEAPGLPGNLGCREPWCL